MKRDITFCSNQKCRLKRCKRHLSNAPKNSEISMAELEGTEYCPKREKLAREIATMQSGDVPTKLRIREEIL